MSALIKRPLELQAPYLDYILVDGSGSMMPKWHDTMNSLQAYVDVLREAHLNAQVILQVFDSHNIESIQRDQRIADWPHLNEDPLSAGWGGTPLYDAINVMCWKLRDLDPENCSIVIVTDGQESGRHSGSKFTDLDQARALLDWCRAKGWSVTFIGAEFNNADVAKLLGGDASSALGVQQTKLLEAGKLLAKKRLRYAQSGEDVGFSEDEQQQFGGYLGYSNG